MFCGWGHPKQCGCDVCYVTFGMSRKAAYRYALKRSKMSQLEDGSMALRKPVPGEFYGPPQPPFNDPEFAAKYPNLTEYLVTSRWADGSIRQTSTLSIFTDGVSLKVVLNDRDNNRSAFFCEETFDDSLAAIEAALANDRVDWKSRSANKSGGMQTPF